MAPNAIFKSHLNEHRILFEELEGISSDVEHLAHVIVRALQSGGKILLCGNGGSSADCQHLAGELVGRFVHSRRPLPAIALSADASLLTCIGNDFGFEHIFARQVTALARPGDVLLAFSTSGQSQNILLAAEAARAVGIPVLGLSGRDGGKLKALCKTCVIVPSQTTARIQEAHVLIYHALCEIIEIECL